MLVDSEVPLVSFVLPHHGRDEMLLDTIQSIAGQDAVAGKLEVIVVSRDANMARDGLISLMEKRGVSVPLTVLNISAEQTISYARNTGAGIATGEYLAFIDSDIRLLPNWVSTMVSILETPSIVLASAVQIPDVERRMNDVIRGGMSEINIGDRIEALPGANLFMRRAEFARSDRFPEHLQTCEDSVFTHSLLSKGKLLLTDKTGFVHLGEDLTLAALFKKEIWRGKSNLDSMQGRAVTRHEIPSIVVPLVVLTSIAMFAVMLAVGRPVLALFFFLAGVAPCLLYAVRLKFSSSIDLGYHKVILFYLVYFSARGTGMVKRMLERKVDLQNRVKSQ